MASDEGAGERGVGMEEVVSEAFAVDADEGEERGDGSLGESNSLGPEQDVVFLLSKVFIWLGHPYNVTNNCLHDLLYHHVPHYLPPRYSVSLRYFCWRV